MERGWIMRLSLLLLLLFAPGQTVNYRNLVDRFITNYNKKSISSNFFRLLVLNLQPRTNNDPATPPALNFTMMETVCPKTKPQHNLDECDFKENGLVSECYGIIISLDATQPSIQISCGWPEELKSGGFLSRIVRSLAKLIYQKYRQLLDKYTILRNGYKKLQDIFSKQVGS
ncbi:protegrin-3-like [Macrotis lagotis]|uniref:protegrin-3-like n=1 Tax=Macrotis lagotis TaxID=92651 RepID=UPI003D697F0E